MSMAMAALLLKSVSAKHVYSCMGMLVATSRLCTDQHLPLRVSASLSDTESGCRQQSGREQRDAQPVLNLSERTRTNHH